MYYVLYLDVPFKDDCFALFKKLLDDLKKWKNDLGDLEGVGNLQGVVQQQEDLIRMIEDQLDRLRQLLLLREQFIALIADITTFIARYTEVIRDIETGGHSTQEKIKKYDDVSCVGFIYVEYRLMIQYAIYNKFNQPSFTSIETVLGSVFIRFLENLELSVLFWKHSWFFCLRIFPSIPR